MRKLLLLMPLALAACATGGPAGPIAIDTASAGQPVVGASCTVMNGNGTWNVVTPVSLNVGAPNSDIRVVCNKAGYRTSEVVFTPFTSSGSSLGVGVGGGGGHVGGGIGLSLPVGMGRGQYPTRITVDMSPQ